MQLKRITVCVALAFAPGAFAAETATMPEVEVTAEKLQPLPALSDSALGGGNINHLRASTSDTAKLLEDQPGISLYGAGGVSSLPVIHGMADDRVRVKVDGMDFIASCPNHMNSPLSSIDPTNVGTVKVYAGITPVSVGGDSIGGSIVVDSPAPVFAAPGQGSLTKGEIGAFYRSNGNAKGGNLSATYATESINLTYSGATAESNNYKAGGNFKTRTDTGVTGHTLPLNEVGSTAYKTRNHTLGFAMKGGNHIVEAKLGLQDIPYELYPNQRMDMMGNTQRSFNLRYVGQLDWGALEARAYHDKVDHFMEFGPDKKFLYTAGNSTQGMPMNTQGRTTGVTAKASIVLTEQDFLRVGGEYQNYRLDDWWPAVVGSAGMGPNPFWNINNGKRDRTALFGEWEKNLGQQWLTLLGLRYERVNTNAGQVHGYNLATFPTAGAGGMMNQTRDAVSFNNANRDKTDNNWDMSALARYTANANNDIEFGFARKVRSPNLYERYTWSTANMMSIMNNFVGDGNGYIGDVNLRPEKAHTLSATFDWHATDRDWEFKATPYYTRVTDYIDAVQWNGATNAARAPLLTNQFVVLKYANQSARLYGLDLSGHMPLAKNGMGELGLKGLLTYTNGKNRNTGDDLYNIMPLNAKLTFTQKLGGWDNGIELVAAKAKNQLSDARNEIRTPGYGLVNLRATYSWKQARIDFGVENLFDKLYALPLGGAYAGQGTTMAINPVDMPWGIPVPGIGRSLYAGATVKF
ncbi:TonB-dependent receptor [Ferrigenium kumadai]|uniref:TonB-dependent receptor n=2 Tax=Ferrigenium kumadai TaxID=1682490 RepID=A0AAN1T2H5_9PROT|nr:TonB-dependent receptor [Ferrigenium kumadai]